MPGPDNPTIETPPALPPAVAAPRLRGGVRGLLLVLLAGSLVRLALTFTGGHIYDLGYYLNWMQTLVRTGFSGFYPAMNGTCDYPPLFLLILRGLGGLLSLHAPTWADEATLRYWLRLPSCLADVAIALLLFFEARRLIGPRAGVAAAALYYLNPATWYVGAFWGQVDSLHSLFVLAACIALNRRRPAWAGVAIALGVLQKLQAIAFVPLVLLDVYRLRRWRGVGACLAAAAVVVAAVLAPFALHGALNDVIEHGYFRVVGQNPYRSYFAFNTWYLTNAPGAFDDTVPAPLIAAFAGPDGHVSATQWIMQLTWRRLSMLLFALAVAIILALYSRNSSPGRRSLAAGLLALAFFLFPTQMHERYLFPLLAVLPLWAIGGPWRERALVVLSACFLLNLTIVLPAAMTGPSLAGVLLVGGAVLLAALAWPTLSAAPVAPEDATRLEAIETVAPARLIRAFCALTAVAAIAFALCAAFVGYRAAELRLRRHPGQIYLEDLEPKLHFQGFGQLARRASVEGDALRLGDTAYVHGLGTHAPFDLHYSIPAGAQRFQARLGISRRAAGTAQVKAWIDDQLVLETGPMRAGDTPAEVDVPVAGAQILRISGSDLGDRVGDHVDIVDARFELNPPAP
jgi:Gpi18-like mannosyltransferase